MRKILLGLVTAFAIVFSCNDSFRPATLNVYLTDAPGDYQEVLIDVKEVEVNMSDEWVSLRGIQTGVYNLLDFTNGLDTLLATDELPEGRISQMRLILGDNNKVKVNDMYYSLKTPSSQQSGLKFNVQVDLVEGVEYNMWIDFDAGKSIVENGNGDYSLKPVIRTFTEATSGAIKGTVSPRGVQTYIYAVSLNEQDTLSTYVDLESGEFLIRGVDNGIYSLHVKPEDPYNEVEIEDIEVILGQVNDVGNVSID